MNAWLVALVALGTVAVLFWVIDVIAEADLRRRRRRRERGLQELYREAASEAGDPVERLRRGEREHDRGAW